MADDMLQDYPVDELLDAMIPVYQKHLTKGEVSALIAFYSAPTGQAIVEKLPVITTESTQATTAVMQKIVTRAIQRVQEALEEESKQDQAKTAEASPAELASSAFGFVPPVRCRRLWLSPFCGFVAQHSPAHRAT